MENKNVKKNKKPLVIIAMVLMVALVVGMGAMTYSKYISSYETPTQTATAAKWGFVVSATTTNLFGSQYKANTGTTATVDGSGDIVVNANPEKNIVAPGTSGYLLVSISGLAEVKAQLSAEFNLTKNITDGAGYLPIEWAITTGDTMPDDGWTTDPTTLMTTINATLPAGTEVTATNYRIYWRWQFSTSAANDVKDTIIGAVTAGTTDVETLKAMTGDDTLTQDIIDAYKTELEFSVNITITQLDQ